MEALVEAGYLECSCDGAYAIHDWYDYAGKLYDSREKNRARVQACRERKRGVLPDM